MKKGFTLVELLVVIGVLSIAGVLVLTIFSRSLRGNNKSQILISIKQNGQSVLETMNKTIRNADKVVCPSIIPPATTAYSNNLVVVTKGIYTRYRLVIPSSTKNGLIEQDNPVKQIDQDTGKEETDPVFVNRVCNPVDPMPSPVILTDTKSDTGVSIDKDPNQDLFTRNKSSGFKDQVAIKFIVKPGVQALAAVAGQIDAVIFQTTIGLR